MGEKAKQWWTDIDGLPMDPARAEALVTGEAAPKTNSEYAFIQANASAVLPGEDKSPKPGKYESNVQFVPPTFVASVSEALDKKQDA